MEDTNTQQLLLLTNSGVHKLFYFTYILLNVYKVVWNIFYIYLSNCPLKIHPKYYTILEKTKMMEIQRSFWTVFYLIGISMETRHRKFSLPQPMAGGSQVPAPARLPTT